MITQLMTTMAEAAATRYGLLIDGWKALYGRALDDPRFGAPVQIREVTEEAYAMARRFLASEGTEISDAMTDIASEAHTATLRELSVEDSSELPDAISEHTDEFIAHLTRVLSIQIENDIATLKKTLQQTILGVTLAAAAQRLPLRTALIQHRVAANTDIQFGFTDRRSAKWPAGRYVKTIWRHNLLSLYNDVVLMTLADAGVDTARVRHTDPTSDIHGLEISIVDNTDLPTLADIRDQAFHPNANAILARSV
ncbi:hypothetical protein IVB12_15995 [Bradyrhizobium sp. 179]|uniref:hypothetical protein n=1 Tax=Bradyrhizobium sp. 179 TaxID=2782648 RepID=UPI001FF711EA|nr:hypothetical protein [Bradyrhizobium sp. 179]MCK1543419.1 hypothetical protein [Bradyrhizobium sp. 179]